MRQRSNMTISGKESQPRRRLTGQVWLPTAVLTLALFFIGLGSVSTSALLTEAPSSLSVTMHNQRFSAHIIRVPLEKVLATLTSYVPIRFFITGHAKNDLISASFSNIPLEKTLEHLLNGYDYAILLHRLEGTSQTSEYRYLTEVEIISRNPTEPSSTSNATYSISSRRTSGQPTLVQGNQKPDTPNQEELLGIGTANDENDYQATLEGVFQDNDPDTRTLVKVLMQELASASE